ncbi:MAG: hypothetical protein PUA69_04210 [Erysipelotrichaceae bacterium]|nr:hypothetical protein [Erysipelotrichaceae bacterium]
MAVRAYIASSFPYASNLMTVEITEINGFIFETMGSSFTTAIRSAGMTICKFKIDLKTIIGFNRLKAADLIRSHVEKCHDIIIVRQY